MLPLTPLKGHWLAPVTQLPTWARGGGRQGQRASAQAHTADPHCPPCCPEQDPRPDTEGLTAGHHPRRGALLGCLETWAPHPTTAPGDGPESLAQPGAIHEGQSCPLAWTPLVAFGQWGLCSRSRGTRITGRRTPEGLIRDPSQATTWFQAGTPEQRAQPQQSLTHGCRETITRLL